MSNPEPLMHVHVSDLELPLYRTDQVAWDTDAIIRTVQTAPPEQTDFLRVVRSNEDPYKLLGPDATAFSYLRTLTRHFADLAYQTRTTSPVSMSRFGVAALPPDMDGVNYRVSKTRFMTPGYGLVLRMPIVRPAESAETVTDHPQVPDADMIMAGIRKYLAGCRGQIRLWDFTDGNEPTDEVVRGQFTHGTATVDGVLQTCVFLTDVDGFFACAGDYGTR